MTNSSRIAVTLMLLGLMPVAAFAQTLRARSYSLKPATGAEDPRLNERVTDAVARNLSLRGMRVNAENPEVQIIPSLSVQITPQTTAYNNGWGPTAWYWASGWGVTTVEARNIQHNTLVIDMVDAKTGQLLWRGKGVSQVNPHWKRDKIDKEVNEMVVKVLRNLP